MKGYYWKSTDRSELKINNLENKAILVGKFNKGPDNPKIMTISEAEEYI